jgi:hypothetical protein
VAAYGGVDERTNNTSNFGCGGKRYHTLSFTNNINSEVVLERRQRRDAGGW